MRTGSNNNNLLKKNVNEDCISFYQIWQELLDPRTLDVYQYRVMNSLSLLKELKSVIEKTISGFFYTDANIQACREELLDSLNHDNILDKYYKPVLNRLRSALGKKPRTDADKKKLMQQVGYTIKIIEPTYLEYALRELKASVLSKKINEIEKYANIVASQAVFAGWSAHALSDLLRYFSQGDTFEHQWDKFERELLNTRRPMHCVFINVPFKNQSSELLDKTINSLERLSLSIKTYDEIVEEFSDIEDIQRLINAKKRYFRIEVEAKDIYSASHLAITRISEQLNFASFYNLVDAWDLQSVVIIAINMQNKYHRSFTANNLYATHDYLDSSGKIFEATRRIFANQENQIIRDKLQGAFGYTNISRASLFQEEKYMNLWVALESLARTNMYSDIISCIKETVPAAMSLRYIYRIVRNFVEDCKRCRISLDFSTCNIDMDQETKQKMVEEMIVVFKRENLFAELKDKCQVNSLLEKRTEDIRYLLTDISFAKKKIENHYKHINWQLQRLYRIRNEIAHAALREQTSLIVYIEHLYHYLSGFIAEIVICLEEKKMTTIEEALSIIKDNYDVFISMVNSSDEILVGKSVLDSGIINLIKVEEKEVLDPF